MEQKDVFESCRAEFSEWMARAVAVSMMHHVRFFREYGLSHSQVFTLRRIQTNGECTVSDIARFIGVTNPAASQLLTQLSERGLVERTRHPLDKRLRYYRLTDDAGALLGKSLTAKSEWMRDMLTGFSEESIRMIGQTFHLLNERIRARFPHEDSCGANQHA